MSREKRPDIFCLRCGLAYHSGLAGAAGPDDAGCNCPECGYRYSAAQIETFAQTIWPDPDDEETIVKGFGLKREFVHGPMRPSRGVTAILNSALRECLASGWPPGQSLKGLAIAAIDEYLAGLDREEKFLGRRQFVRNGLQPLRERAIEARKLLSRRHRFDVRKRYYTRRNRKGKMARWD